MPSTTSVVLDVTRLIKINFIGGVQQVIWDAIETGEILEFVAFNSLVGRWQTISASKIQSLRQQISRPRSRFRLQFGIALYALSRKIPALMLILEWLIKAKAKAKFAGNKTKSNSGLCILHEIQCPNELNFLLLDIPLDFAEIKAIEDFDQIAKCNARVDKSVYVHDLMPISAPKMVDDSHKEKLHKKFTNYLELISKFTNICANSKHTKQELLEFNQKSFKNVKVIYPAIPGTFQGRQYTAKLATPGREPIVFTIGPWTERKRFYLVFEALSQLSDQGVSFALHVRRNLSASVCRRTVAAFETLQRKCPEKIRTLNYLTPSDLENEYFAAKVVTIPSAYEGFGLPILQAAGAGAHVACSRNSALEEAGTIIGASFVEKDTPESWAEVLADLLRREDAQFWRNTESEGNFVWQILESKA